MKTIKSIIFAISFLTIFPVKNINFSEEEIKNSIKFFPLTGFFMGIILYIISLLPFKTEITSLIVLFFMEFLSGFFHLDGLADTSDAIFSAKYNKSILFKIMNDSNIGTMGAVTLFFVLFGKYFLIKNLLIEDKNLLIVVPLAGRFAINFLSYKMNYAKEEGLGKFICENNTKSQFLISIAITVLVILIANSKALLSFILIIAILFIYSKYFNKKFGGVTGDLFGFSVETTELFFMLFLMV